MGGKKKEKKEKKGRGTKERSRDEVSEIDVHSVADSRFCNILFGTANTERTNHFSQARGGVSFRFIRVLFFFFVFCFLLFFPFCPSWTDHRLSKFIENVVSINAKRIFYFYRWMPIPIWDASFRLASLFSSHSVPFLSRFGLPVTLKLSRGCCRNLTRKIVDDTGPVIHGMTDRSSDAPSRFPPLVVVIEPVVDPRQNIANQPLARRLYSVSIPRVWGGGRGNALLCRLIFRVARSKG